MKNFNNEKIDMLMDSISQLCAIDAKVLQSVIDEINSTDIPYQHSYNDYQSGGWGTAMLYNSSGDMSNNHVSEGEAVATKIVEILPKTREMIEELGFNFFNVRIAKNEPNSFLWEHKDYVELGDTKKMRLHIPLESNEDSLMQFSSNAVHMQPGHVWKINPMDAHSISNSGKSARTHLILDCYVDNELQNMISYEFLNQNLVKSLPLLDDNARTKAMDKAQLLLNTKGVKETEHFLLKTFHSHDLGTKSSYDLLIDFFSQNEFKSREKYWIQQYLERMVSRQKLSSKDARVNLRGVFYEARHHSPDIPQYGILKEIVETVRHIPGLDTAYVRGSLANGNADRYSDIDVLCVVSPDHLCSFLDTVDGIINNEKGALFPAWSDTIVKDFGGAGYVYLLQKDKKIYQLDLYVAVNGHPNIERLHALENKQEIFRTLNTHSDVDRMNQMLFKLHENDVKSKLKSISNQDHTVEQNLAELSVLSLMIKKCIKRGDSFVAANEFNMWKQSLIKLARHKLDPELTDYGFYHVDKLQSKGETSKVFFRNMCAINNAHLTNDNFKKMYQYSMKFIESTYPSEYKKYKESIELLDTHILRNDGIYTGEEQDSNKILSTTTSLDKTKSPRVD